MASKTLLEDLKSEQSIPLFRSASHLYSAAPPESVSTSKYTFEPGFNELQLKKWVGKTHRRDLKLLGQLQNIKISNLRQSHPPLTINDRARAFPLFHLLNNSVL